MDILGMLLTIVGLALFEIVSSVDNAIINAQVLSTMKERSRRWFLLWGMFIAVFVVRGFFPLLLVWLVNPNFTLWEALVTTFSGKGEVIAAIEHTAPLLLIGGGTFLIFIFFHWLFLEEKKYGIRGEHFFWDHGVWFYASVSIILTYLVWMALLKDPFMALGAVVGSTAFFITHGFKEQSAQQEKRLFRENLSDISKLFYLEVIDATFSIDGVLGAFAFTFIIPLILLGNGLGAIAVRQITLKNIERVGKYPYLKNGAMYSVFALGLIMILESFGYKIPAWLPPMITILIIGYFFLKSVRETRHDVAIG